MRKSSKAISLLLSGLMATSCFSMAVAPVSAAPVESEATGVDTAAQRVEKGHQLVYFQFPDSVWGSFSSVKRNAKKWTTNVFCNYYAIYGNTNEVKSRSWEAPSTAMLQDTKGGILYFDITESGQGEMEDGAVYGILFSTKANKGQADLLQPNTDGYQTCDLYLDTTLLGHTWTIDTPAVVRENTANSQKIDYLAHSDNNVSGPLRKVSTLCAYIDGMEAGTAPKSLEMANALQTYLPNPVNNSSFVWQKIEPVLEKFDTTAQEVYDTYVEKYGALLEEATPYEHVDGVDDLKSDGTLKDVYRYSSITTTTVEDGVEQTKTVKYPWLDLVRERLNLPAQDEPTVTDIENVSVSTEAVFAPGEAVPAADDFTSTSDEYTLSNVTVTPADETFAYGTEYTVSITATPAEGYQMTDGTGFTLVVGGDGPESYNKVINEDGTLTATYVFAMPAKTDITTVAVDTDALFSPNEAIPGNDAFTYDNTQYTIGDFTITPADETFAYEGVYTLTYTATPAAGYQMTDNTGISLSFGGDATADNSYLLNDDGTMTITYTFTMPAAPQPEDTLVVAGSEAEIFGTAWDGTNEANLMTKQDNGTYTKEYTVDKAYTAVQLKSVKNGAEWIGDETGNNVTFNLTGAGTFTVVYNPETNITSVQGDIVEFITEFTYETVYAAGNGEGTWLNGASWDAAYVGNEMTEVAEGIWEIEFTNVPDGFERQIKFCIDGAWTHNFGGAFEESGVASDAAYNGDNITFDTDDTCTVKAQLDLTNFDFTTKEGAKFTITITYDEEPTDAPATEAPATEAPATEAPATEAPATEAPATEAPATEAPATEAPATEAPATEAPATEAPATEAPATEAPATEAPATEAPATEPVTEAPATEPATEEPVVEDTLVVAGSEAEIFGTAWDGTNEANLMTKQGDGTYTREYTVDKAYTAVQLKSVKNGAEWIGDETGNNVTFNLTGAGTFTVVYDPETNITSVQGDIVEFITEFTYETVYAAGNGEGTWLNGASWDATYVANEMTEVADDIWEIEFTNVPDGFERQIKFCIDGAWTHNFGGTFEDSGVASDAAYNGDNITFDTDDTCTVKAQLDLTNFDFTTKEGAKFTITITYGSDAEEVGIIGDVNGDGNVTIDDATMIQQRGIELITFDETQEKLGDVNGDGRVSILDVTCIQKYLAEYTTGTGNAGDKLLSDGTIVPAN